MQHWSSEGAYTAKTDKVMKRKGYMEKREKCITAFVGPHLSRKSDTLLINSLLYAMKIIIGIRKEIM